MTWSDCPADDTFGPIVRGCRNDFDFTITFERIFLSLIPAAVFIAIALARIPFLVWAPEIVGGKFLWGVKLATTVAYTSVQLSLLVLNTLSGNDGALYVSSATVSLASALCIIAVSLLEHSRSPRPSFLLTVYLFVTLLFDITQVRTSWLMSARSDGVVGSRLLSGSAAVKGFLLLLETLPKSKWVRWDPKAHSPEETSGVLGLASFAWMNQLFLAGFKRILTLDDLLSLDRNMATEALRSRLTEKLDNLASGGQKYGLTKALAKTLLVPLLLPIGPRVALIGFRFCQPFLINTLLDYLQPETHRSEKRKDAGYGLIGASVLIYGGIAVSTALYWYLHERMLCMCRGSLAGVIYEKVTEVELSTASDSAAVTLMSTDVERIRLGFLNLHEFWANTIEVGLASWLVERELGAAFVAPLIVVLCCVLCAAFANRYTGERQKAWMAKIQKRVGLTADAIANMKDLKISGITYPVETTIQDMRVDELKTASRFRFVYVIVSVLGYAPLALSPVITFAVTSRTLNVGRLFTSVSYLLLLADPLGYLFQNTPNLLAAFSCLERIQAFLLQGKRVDFRLSKWNESAVGLEKREERLMEDNEKFRPAISIIDGNFGWEQDKLSLRGLNLDIPKACLTMVVGPVASGKSTLCKVLLGEVPVSRGQVIISSSVCSCRIGYCDQTPYLTNTTIRASIIGSSAFNQGRYNEVIHAVMLEPDLSVLARGDETRIGSNGISLSGGQKQRLSMARALYIDSDFLIFDDVMKGLDANTEEQVFHRVFGPGGLLRRRNATAVLCTHAIRHLPYADYIVALGEGGTLVEQGTLPDLVSNRQYIHSLGIEVSDIISAAVSTMPTSDAEKASQLGLDGASVTAMPLSSSVDEKTRRHGDSSVYWHYLASIGKRFVFVFIIFGLGWGFFYNWGNIWLQYWASDISSPNPSRSNSFYVGLYALFQTTYLACLLFCLMICFRTMIEISGAKLHKEALRTIFSAHLGFFTTTDTGQITNLFSQDMTLIDNELPIAVTNLALDISNAVGMAAVVATSSPFLVISYPFLLIILYLIQKFYLRTARQLRLLDLESKSPLYTHFLDTIKGVVTLRALGWSLESIKENDHLVDRSQRPYYLLYISQRWLAFTLQVLVAILAILVVTLATQLGSRAGLTGASLVTLMTFGDILNYIMRFFSQLETSIGAINRLKYFSDRVRPESEPEDKVPPVGWPSQGGIDISRISASYDTVSVDMEEFSSDGNHSNSFTLNNLTLSIKPGEKLAICGRTGSGKSSILLLLLRLLDPVPDSAGSITIDGKELCRIERSSLRRCIIAVPQHVVLLPDGTSLKTNLDPFDTATDCECRGALDSVGLRQLIDECGGLAGPLSADVLSQGQKQLFSLARAILRRKVRSRDAAASNRPDGGILLLDELNSGVDHDTDRAMQRLIQEEFEGYTVVAVSHRLETVMHFDTVVVMDKGRLIEIGNPRNLAQQDGSHFKELWAMEKKTG